ncbi:MAG: hypothetical protein [Wigfec virus K19_83]|nr:MAG: hypothetical protein [Wigfec virus K19_83]
MTTGDLMELYSKLVRLQGITANKEENNNIIKVKIHVNKIIEAIAEEKKRK